MDARVDDTAKDPASSNDVIVLPKFAQESLHRSVKVDLMVVLDDQLLKGLEH